MQINKELLSYIGVSNKNIDTYLPFLQAYASIYQVNTKERVAAFLMNILHESAYLNTIVENLNYSADGLKKVFPKYFNANEYSSFARKPKAIANRVYANRMGNGNEASGDGWKFRGKGAMQVTGKKNHDLCGKFMGVDLLKDPDLLLKPQYAIWSSFWFWISNNLNQRADLISQAKNEEEKTKLYKSIGGIINVGSPNATPIGWEDRNKIRKLIEKYDELKLQKKA